jgi:hypothetical protein
MHRASMGRGPSMRRMTKLAAVVVVLVLATMLVSCGRPDPTDLALKADNRTVAGVPLQLVAYLDYFGSERGPTADEAAWDRAQLEWTVQPSGGALISREGVFKGTKPGVYSVTVQWYQRSRRLVATTKVYVTEARSTDTTEETETTEGSETTESTEITEPTETTEGTVASSYAGAYAGTWTMTMFDTRDVPWGFTVDAEGNVQGGLDYSWDGLAELSVTLTGRVSNDGVLTASGTGTTKTEAESVSNAVSFNGQISGATFTGVWEGENGKSGQLTATRQ